MVEENLLIRKASAGSGKTYALAQHYLDLVLNTKDVKAFSKIMAMTFTNKAAIEMKDRIIQNLVTLSYQDKADEKARQFIGDTSQELGLSPEAMQNRAQKVLKSILHNYGELSISTIDKFNVRLVRTFTKDLDLPADFEVLIDTSEFYDKVVDQLIENIGLANAQQISDLLISFSKQNADEQRKWSFKDTLLEFIKTTKKEQNLPIIKAIQEKRYDRDKKNAIFSALTSIEKEFNCLKNELISGFETSGCSYEDFKTGLTDIYKRIEKLSYQKMDKVELLTPKMSENLSKEIHEHQRTKLPIDFVKKIATFYDWLSENKEQYNVLKYLQQSFYQLALLQKIENHIEMAQKKERVILINEFNQLIAKLIQSENAPYIYERLGTKFDHYLLDEFQDTSRLQWQNLIPLVHESLSNGNTDFIVGDAKQAIYRFNNGVVEQFAALPRIYNPENIPALNSISNYFEQRNHTIPLDDNYRSKEEIVKFNNALFASLRNVLKEDFQAFYNDKDLIQHPKKGTGGYVFVEQTDEEEKFLLQAVKSSLEDGFAPKDICVLVNKNKIGVPYAQLLLENGYKVVSNEALKIASSEIVCLFIHFMRYREQSVQVNLQILFIESYLRFVKSDDILTRIEKIKEKNATNPIHAFAEQVFGDRETLDFSYENLYDLAQKLIRLMQIDELQNPYLHHFCDMLHEFDLKNGPDIKQFLTYYDNSGYKESVVLSEASNAINIMTVHKSKGLQFPVVIIPNLNWTTSFSNNQQQILFNDTNHDEVYIAGTKATEGGSATRFQLQENKHEIDKILLDTINLFYVACTRAENRLYIAHADSSKSNTLGKLVKKYLPTEMLAQMNENTYSFGVKLPIKVVDKHDNDAIFQPKTKGDRLWFPDIALIDKEALDGEFLNDKMRFGTQFHLVLSELSNPDELDSKIEELLQNEQIDAENMTQLMGEIANLFQNNDLVRLLFPQEGEILLAEKEIVINEGKKIRPDRVVINQKYARIVDFKTGIPKEKDRKQVLQYKLAMEQMGYENCKAFLIYTDNQRIVPVA